MKIEFFRHSLLSRGGDKMIVVYANHLVASGHKVTIKTNVVDTVFYLDERVELSPLRFPGKLGSIFSAFFEKSSADFIIADIVVMVCLLSFRNSHRLICFAQDYDESYYSSNIQKLFIRFMYILGMTLFKIRTIAVSKPLAELLRYRFNADVRVVENGIDPNSFFIDPDPELVSLKEGRKSVLLHSRKDYRKGFDIAVEVIRRLKSKISIQFEVWTVGVPVHDLFPDVVHRDFGYVDETNLRKIMSSSDIFLYPTRHEGLPLMPLEAMACGCSVVTTTAVPFAIHGENALVAQIEDCDALMEYLHLLLNDRQLSGRLISSGKFLADHHSLADAARQFENTLLSLH